MRVGRAWKVRMSEHRMRRTVKTADGREDRVGKTVDEGEGRDGKEGS
jgi:hypothetical protein